MTLSVTANQRGDDHSLKAYSPDSPEKATTSLSKKTARIERAFISPSEKEPAAPLKLEGSSVKTMSKSRRKANLKSKVARNKKAAHVKVKSQKGANTCHQGKVTLKTDAIGRKVSGLSDTASVLSKETVAVPSTNAHSEITITPSPEIPGIPKLKLTQKALEHVFEGKVQKQKKTPATLSGMHYDYKYKKGSDFFYMSSKTLEISCTARLVAVNKRDNPVYKTFFPASWSRETVIKEVVDSLANIILREIQPDGKRLYIKGMGKSGISIITIAEISTGKIITFFPFTKLESSDFSELKELRSIFTKYFHGNSIRAPLDEVEIGKLLEKYGDGIPVNMVFLKPFDFINKAFLKAVSMEREELLQEINLAAQKVKVLLPANFNLDELADMDELSLACVFKWLFILGFGKTFSPDQGIVCKQEIAQRIKELYPDICAEIEIKNLSITKEVLYDLEKNDTNFPPYLTRFEILQYLQEALEGFDELFLKEPEMINEFDRFNYNDVPGITEPLPVYAVREDEFWLHGYSIKENDSKSFRFMIKLNRTSGKLLSFYPLIIDNATFFL